MFAKPESSIDTQDGLKQQQRRYLNACVVGQPSATADPASGTLCKYDATYTTAILDNPKEWVLGIDRFNIPMLRVPRFIDPSTQTPSSPATLTIVATDLTTGVVNPFTATVQISGVVTPDPFSTGYVYLVSQWVASINAALVTASSSLFALGIAPPAPPLLVFNATTGIISLLTPSGWYGTGGSHIISTTTGDQYTLDMYFNQSLWRFLPTLPQTFFNYSSATSPINTNTFYSKVSFLSSPTSPITPVLAASLPNFAPGSTSLTSVSAGTLQSSLTAGTNYTQLSISGGGVLWYLAAGQAIVLSDSASGTTQTVFVAEGDCKVGATTLNTLLFTAVFAFPAATTTVRIFSITAIVLNIALFQSMPVGTQLTIDGSTTFTLSRPASPADSILYVTPTFTSGEAKNGSVVQFLNPLYDTLSTESTVPPIWTSISSVRVKSTKLPLCMEFSPDVVTSSAMTSSQAPVVPMVTDFVIDTSSTLQTADLVQFVTENPRWVDLVGDSPLYSIDLIVVWVDYQGNEHPVYIPAGYRFDMKVNFKRKYTKCLPGF